MSDLTMEELLADFVKDVGASVPEAPEWVIEGVLPVGITFLVGPPKTMKSTLLMMWSAQVAGHAHKGLPDLLNTVVSGGRVVGMSGEASAGELRYMAKEGFGCDIPDDCSVLVADDPWKWRLDDDVMQTKMLRILDVLKPKLFFIDPLANYHDQDEKDSGTMIRLLLPLRAWARRNSAAVVVAHHARKASSDPKAKGANTTRDDVRGSGAIFGLCDGLLLLTRKGDGQIRIEACFKRGAEWEQTIQLNVWEPTKLKVQKVTPEMLKAAELVASGCTWVEVATQLSVGVGTVGRWLKIVATAAGSSASDHSAAKPSNTPPTPSGPGRRSKGVTAAAPAEE